MSKVPPGWETRSEKGGEVSLQVRSRFSVAGGLGDGGVVEVEVEVRVEVGVL